MAKAKQVWIHKFHPNNGRLTMIRIRKMSDDTLGMWIAHGTMANAVYSGRDEIIQRWGMRGPSPMSMFEWTSQKLAQLERERDRRTRYKRTR